MASAFDNYDWITALYGKGRFKGWDPRSQRPAGLPSGRSYAVFYPPHSAAAAAATLRDHAALNAAAAEIFAAGATATEARAKARAMAKMPPLPRKLRVVTYDEIKECLMKGVQGELDYPTRVKLSHVASIHKELRHPGIQRLLAIIPHRSPTNPGCHDWDGVGPSEVSFVYEAGTPLREAVKRMSLSERAAVAFEAVRQVGPALVHMHEMPAPIPGKEARLQPQPVNTVFLGLSLDTVSVTGGPINSTATVVQISDLAPATKFWCMRIYACHPASMAPEVSSMFTSDNQGGIKIKFGQLFDHERASKAHAFALGRLAAEIAVGEPVAPVVAVSEAPEPVATGDVPAAGTMHVYPWEQHAAWPTVPAPLKELITSLTRADPAQRASIESVLDTLPAPLGPPLPPSKRAPAKGHTLAEGPAKEREEEGVLFFGSIGLPALSAKSIGSEASRADPQQPSTPAAVAARTAVPANDASGIPIAVFAAAAAVGRISSSEIQEQQQQQVSFGPAEPKRSIWERAAHRCAKRLQRWVRYEP